jgi:hypothetical protein
LLSPLCGILRAAVRPNRGGLSAFSIALPPVCSDNFSYQISCVNILANISCLP